MPRNQTPGLPTRQQILDFIAAATEPAGKREIARAFGLKGQEKIALKALLKDIQKRLNDVRSPFRTAEKFGIEDIIDPRDTRTVLGQCLSVVNNRAVEGAQGYGVFRL